MIRYADIKSHPNHVQELTDLTVQEFEQFVVPFDAAYREHMQHWTMEGKPRTARAYTPYANSPLPTPEDRLLFILSYLKGPLRQVDHSAMFGMSQSNANKWIAVLLLVLFQALVTLDGAARGNLQNLKWQIHRYRADIEDVLLPFSTPPQGDPLHAPKIRFNKELIWLFRDSH